MWPRPFFQARPAIMVGSSCWVLLLLVLQVTISLSEAAPSKSDCKPPKLLSQSSRFPVYLTGETFYGYCNFTDPDNSTTVKLQYFPGDSSGFNKSVVYGHSTVKTIFSVRNVSIKNQGNYRATASNKCGSAVCNLSLSVEDACHGYQTPVPRTNNSKLFVNKTHGSTVTFNCTFDGDPDPSHFEIMWGYNGKTDIVDRDTHNKYSKTRKEYAKCTFVDFLMISNASSSDSGEYSCRSRSYLGGGALGPVAITYLFISP